MLTIAFLRNRYTKIIISDPDDSVLTQDLKVEALDLNSSGNQADEDEDADGEYEEYDDQDKENREEDDADGE